MAHPASYNDGQPNSWNMSIELWYSEGGIEIFGNTIMGPVDLAGGYTKKGDYAFAADIHDNVIGPAALQTNPEYGLYAERVQEGPVYVRNNTFRNVATAVAVYPSIVDTVANLYIVGNIIDPLAVSKSTDYAIGIEWSNITSEFGTTVNNINVANNVFNGGENAWMGMKLPNIGNATGVTVRNNIFQGFGYAPIFGNMTAGTDVSIDTLSIENNVFWNNVEHNDPVIEVLVPTNSVIQNNIDNADPLFVSASDFHLRSGSPGIDAGLALPYYSVDHEGVAVQNPPNIGCFETTH